MKQRMYVFTFLESQRVIVTKIVDTQKVTYNRAF